MLKYVLFFIMGAGLLACSSVNTISVNSASIIVSNVTNGSTGVDTIIKPYRDSLDDEMKAVIAISKHDFVKDRPNSPLNNWCADALLNCNEIQLDSVYPTIALLNVGGIRSTINKGEVTLGDLFKLMPFDNEVVIVKMPISSLKDIQSYIIASGGEPIAGAELIQSELVLNHKEVTEYFWIITSDYLFNGGDKMNFFKSNLEVIQTGVLLRDVFISVAKSQEVFHFSSEQRIKF